MCAANCQVQDGQTSFCGDGRIDGNAGEQCDDGNLNDNDGCTNDCRQSSVCGDGIVDVTEECDGDATTAYCGADCQCAVEFGAAQYGEPCERSVDCETGYCLPNPLNNNEPQCTQPCLGQNECPGNDRCSVVGAPGADVCLNEAMGLRPGELVTACLPNEMGRPCNNALDCPVSRLCISPGNPMPGQVDVLSVCSTTCQNNDECPAGYTCGLVQNQFGDLISACLSTAETTPCSGLDAVADFFACQNVCPNLLNTACYAPLNFANNGFCTCTCNSANDCPVGYACGRGVANTGDPANPGVCQPISGYRCTGNANACLSLSCATDPAWPESGYCVSSCDGDFDCPADYGCVLSPGGGQWCEPI